MRNNSKCIKDKYNIVDMNICRRHKSLTLALEMSLEIQTPREMGIKQKLREWEYILIDSNYTVKKN